MNPKRTFDLIRDNWGDILTVQQIVSHTRETGKDTTHPTLTCQATLALLLTYRVN